MTWIGSFDRVVKFAGMLHNSLSACTCVSQSANVTTALPENALSAPVAVIALSRAKYL